jgi:hypothetical protein
MSPIKLILASMIPLTLMASANKPVPPAGVVDRQIELEYEAKEIDAEKQIPLLEIDIPEKKFDMGDEKALINTVKFKGNTVISSRTLKKPLKIFMEKEVSIGSLKAGSAIFGPARTGIFNAEFSETKTRKLSICGR